ncbi:MAG: site-specific DNA-methyltransferase [archaeon]|nr:site-specific DNA-methyltransferase [archaeon]
MIRLINSDCLQAMDDLIDEGIVIDAIITDPPYGKTACEWDSVIPFPEMWERINKLIKPDGAIVLFGSEPFSSQLRLSNLKNYKYDWIWEKTQSGNFINAKKQPLREHENILVFYQKQCIYNPQKYKIDEKFVDKRKKKKERSKNGQYGHISDLKRLPDNGFRYPTSILKFSSIWKNGMHSTQKPVELMEYLIKTYTNEGDLVLDFTMGSGTTGVAAKNLFRDFIGIEKEKKYFEIAKQRINNTNSLFYEKCI